LSDKRFNFYFPDGNHKVIFYHSKNDFQEKVHKLDILFNHIVYSDEFRKELKEINNNQSLTNEQKNITIRELKQKYSDYNVYNYCIDSWMWLHKFDPFKHNYEDKVKMFLNRCGTFLLLGLLKRGQMLTDGRKKEINKNEVLLSSSSSDIQDLVDGNSANNFKMGNSRSYNLIQNELLLGNYDEESVYKIPDTYKKTKQYKIKKIYKQPDRVKKIIVKLTNKDIFDSNNLKYPEFNNNEDLSNWLKKPFKNVHGENIWKTDIKTMKQNKNGIINPTLPYLQKWCNVWTDNTFEFQGDKYLINENVKQYKPIKKNSEFVYEMDQILVYKQSGNMYYFDMSINSIDTNLIVKISD
jgi:hypothetical protein